jgi:HAD superfamily hydrolase (TIGR01509 family)
VSGLPDPARLRAVLFDVDGTLVDSNYLHVAAWMEAFTQAGAPVDAWRVHRDIGMDSKRLLADLLGDRVDELGEQAKDGHKRAYAGYASLLRPFAGARDLLRALAERGITVVLATSAPPDELAMLRRALDCDDAVSAETNADDVEEAKPQPDVVQVALERAGCSAEEAVFVGDAVWDVKAAHKAGLACIGVLTGGIARGELEEAGADLVLDSVADVEGALFG